MTRKQKEPTEDEKIRMLPQKVSFHDEKNQIWGCPHYSRRCRLVAKCCGKVYGCRFCHDEAEHQHHTIDRFATEQMQCMYCFQIMPVGKVCTNADCTHYQQELSKYYCEVCKLWDDLVDGKEVYHCTEGCNICRVGKGLGKDVFHCKTCNACYDITADEHRCSPNSAAVSCPFCLENLSSSRQPALITSCGHLMHHHCVEDYLDLGNYRCPVCRKSLIRWSPEVLSIYQAQLDLNPMPSEYANHRAVILCNDCKVKSTVKYHFCWMQCPHCLCFNTNQLTVIVPSRESASTVAQIDEAVEVAEVSASSTSTDQSTSTSGDASSNSTDQSTSTSGDASSNSTHQSTSASEDVQSNDVLEQEN